MPKGVGLALGAADVGLGEIVPDKQQGVTGGGRSCVGDAIPEIQSRRVAAATESIVGGGGRLPLVGAERLGLGKNHANL